jgi:hypothetical protein
VDASTMGHVLPVLFSMTGATVGLGFLRPRAEEQNFSTSHAKRVVFAAWRRLAVGITHSSGGSDGAFG